MGDRLETAATKGKEADAARSTGVGSMRSGIEATSPAVGFVALRADRDEHPEGRLGGGLQPAHDFHIAGQYAKGLQPIAN